MSVLDLPETKYRQADQALEKNDPRQAEQLLRELVHSEPDEPLFHWKLGYALSEMEKYQEAIPELEQALKLDPQNVAALGCLGRAYMELGNWDRAEKIIRSRLDVKKSPQHYVFLAHILMEKDQYGSAEEYCRKAIDLDPSFAEAFLNLGLVYRHKKQIKEAIQAFQKATTLDDGYSLAFRELGLTYYVLGKFDLAKKALATCLALNHDDGWGHLYLALCLQDMGDFKEASTHFVTAIENDPKNIFFEKKQEEFLRRIAKSEDKNPTSKEPWKSQTISIGGDANFLALDAYGDGLLQQKGFKRVAWKGSTSWIDRRIQPADAAVRFKLFYYGPDNIKFGVRHEFVTECGFTPDQIDCAEIIVVLPSSVEFVGFTVQNNEAGRIRIANVVTKFP